MGSYSSSCYVLAANNRW